MDRLNDRPAPSSPVTTVDDRPYRPTHENPIAHRLHQCHPRASTQTRDWVQAIGLQGGLGDRAGVGDFGVAIGVGIKFL
jgi:hypothetical protein